MAYINKITLPSGSKYDYEGSLNTVYSTQANATSAWTGTTTLEALKAGTTIGYFLQQASASTAVTLNLTLADNSVTGAIPVYFDNTTRVTTQFAAGSLIIMTYNGTNWYTNNYISSASGHTYTGDGKIIVDNVNDTISHDDFNDVTAPQTGGFPYAGEVDSTGHTAVRKFYGVTTRIDDDSTNDELPTALGVQSYVDAVVSHLPDPMVFKGTIGTSGTVEWANLPTAASSIGFTYKVITAHATTPVCEVGDLIVSNGSEWVVIPAGDEPSGTVTNVATGAGLTGGPITSTGTIKANLDSETPLTPTTGYTIYPIGVDSNNKLAVKLADASTPPAPDTYTVDSGTGVGTFKTEGTTSIFTATPTTVVTAQGQFTAGDYPHTFSVSNEVLTISNGTKPSLAAATTDTASTIAPV